jgi:predicted DNA-binding protein (MmcQ/YjbR family)
MARNKWVNLAQIDDWADEELAEHLAIAHGIVAGKLTKKVRAALGLT